MEAVTEAVAIIPRAPEGQRFKQIPVFPLGIALPVPKPLSAVTCRDFKAEAGQGGKGEAYPQHPLPYGKPLFPWE